MSVSRNSVHVLIYLTVMPVPSSTSSYWEGTYKPGLGRIWEGMIASSSLWHHLSLCLAVTRNLRRIWADIFCQI